MDNPRKTALASGKSIFFRVIKKINYKYIMTFMTFMTVMTYATMTLTRQQLY